MTISTTGRPTESVEETVIDLFGCPTTVRRRGNGRATLFLHGAFFPTRWPPLLDLLSEHVDLIAPIHPGYREGNPPPWLRGFDDLVLHYHDFMDRLELDQVDLIGYDLGGWLAAEVASFYPERVRSMTLIAASGLRLPDAPMMEFLAAEPKRLVDALFNGKTPDGFELASPADIDGFVESYGENGVTARLIWERRYDTQLDRRVGRLLMPVLVIAATDDRLLPFAHAQRWNELLRNSRLVALEDSSHAMPFQSPNEVAALILGFLAEVA